MLERIAVTKKTLKNQQIARANAMVQLNKEQGAKTRQAIQVAVVIFTNFKNYLTL